MTTRLDPQLNVAPDDIRHIHIMGVCGTGMAAIAGMLKESGYRVTGSDQNVYPPMSDFLAQAGIEVMQGYVPENLEPRPDLVIVGNVIQAVFPEAQRLGRAWYSVLVHAPGPRLFFPGRRKSEEVSGGCRNPRQNHDLVPTGYGPVSGRLLARFPHRRHCRGLWP